MLSGACAVLLAIGLSASAPAAPLIDLTPNSGGQSAWIYGHAQIGARTILDGAIIDDQAPTSTNRLWVTDGTSVGTKFLTALHPDSRGLVWTPVGLKSAMEPISDQRMIIMATPSPLVAELFVSDGTPEGTAPLADSILTGGPLTFPAHFANIFWTRDGEAYVPGEGGTILATDGRSQPRVAFSTESTETVLEAWHINGALFFTTWGEAGPELYRMQDGSSPRRIATSVYAIKGGQTGVWFVGYGEATRRQEPLAFVTAAEPPRTILGLVAAVAAIEVFGDSAIVVEPSPRLRLHAVTETSSEATYLHTTDTTGGIGAIDILGRVGPSTYYKECGQACALVRIKDDGSREVVFGRPEIFRAAVFGDALFVGAIFGDRFHVERVDETSATRIWTGPRTAYNPSFTFYPWATADALNFVYDAKTYKWTGEGEAGLVGSLLANSSRGSRADQFHTAGDRAVFATDIGAQDVLYGTDGSAAGTVPLERFVDIREFGEQVGEERFFAGRTLVHGDELWATDGRSARLVADLVTGPGSTFPSQFTRLGDKLLFATRNELFVTNGRVVVSLAESQFGIANLRANGDVVQFIRAEEERFDAWETDGTVAGTRKVGLLGVDFDAFGLVVRGEFYWFSRRFGSVHLLEGGDDRRKLPGFPDEPLARLEVCDFAVVMLYRDSEVAAVMFEGIDDSGAPIVTEFVPGPDFSRAACHEGVMYFTQRTPDLGMELWRYAGGRLELAADLNPGLASSDPAQFKSFGRDLLFAANHVDHGRELWRIRNGQSATMLQEGRAGPASTMPLGGRSGTYAVVDGGLLFGGLTAQSGIEPFRLEVEESGLIIAGPPTLAGGGGCRTAPGCASIVLFGLTLLLMRRRRR